MVIPERAGLRHSQFSHCVLTKPGDCQKALHIRLIVKTDSFHCQWRFSPGGVCGAVMELLMLNQASTDRIELAKLLNISDLQMSYITNVGAGQGLLKVGSSLVPFINKFPRNTELYKLMTTKFGEV